MGAIVMCAAQAFRKVAIRVPKRLFGAYLSGDVARRGASRQSGDISIQEDMNVQGASSNVERAYLLPQAGKPSPSVDQKILSNEVPFFTRALFSSFNACFMAGTDKDLNEDALSGEITSAVKLGMDMAVLPFPALNLLGLLKEWENACGRHGEILANEGLIASLERDGLELDAQLKSWPTDDPGRPDRQKEIDAKRALCQQLTARNNALRALAPPIEGRAATVGSAVIPMGMALNKIVSSGLGLHAGSVTNAADATVAQDLSDVAASTVSGLALGLINGVCHLIRAFPEVDRAMAQLEVLNAAEHRLAGAVEVCLAKFQGRAGMKVVLNNVVASMIPLIGNTRNQARIVAVDGFFRTVHGASGLALRSAGIAALVLGPAATFAGGVAIAGAVMGASWLSWQVGRLWWAHSLRGEAAKIENQLKNDVAIAKQTLAAGAEKPTCSAEMAPWLELIEACREERAQGPLASFLRQAGLSESVISACLSKEKAAIDLVVPLFSAFKESLLTAMPEVTQERIDALKKRNDPRDVLNGFILEVENPVRPVKPEGNKRLHPTALQNQGNTLTLEEVQRHVAAFKPGAEVDLSDRDGHAATLLKQFFVDVTDGPQNRRTLEEDLLTKVKLFIDLSRNSDERAIACLSGRYPGIRGKAKFGTRVVKETAEAYLRSKYAGPAFDEKLALLKHLAKKNALVRWSSPLECLKTHKVWQSTEAATEMAKWLADPQHVPSARLVARVFEKHRGVSESEHGGAVSCLMLQFVGKDWPGDDLSAALKALETCQVKSLFDNRVMEETESARAVEYALWLRSGLVPSAEAELNPVLALKSLHARHPQVAQAVLEALMGKRFEVPVVADDAARQVRAIRDAYADHFLEGETKGNAVFFIPRKPGPEESKVLANLVKGARKDARGQESWPSILITPSTAPLLKAVHKKANSSFIRRLFGKVLSFLPLISWLPISKRFLKKLETESHAIKALADQLQRSLDSARKKVPESFSPLWTPEYCVGTEVEHAVRAQRLRSIFSDEPYDEADSEKCRDIDDTVNMLDAWRREVPRGREVLRVIAQGGPIQSKAAMHWLFDRPNILPDSHQEEIRRIAKLMPARGGSSKSFLKTLAVWHVRERSKLPPMETTDDINRYASLKDLLDHPASFKEIKDQFQPDVTGIPQSRSAADLLKIGREQTVKGRSRSRSLGSEELQAITQEVRSRRLSAFSTTLDFSAMTKEEPPEVNKWQAPRLVQMPLARWDRASLKETGTS